jgi:HlyD family secretion protein
MKRILQVIVPLLLAGAAAWFAYQHWGRKPSPNASVIRVSGNIEVTDAELSFKIPGRIETRAVSEGQAVKAGQLVAKLEQGDLEQETKLRAAEVEVAKAFLAELEAGTRLEELAQAEAAVELAQAEAARAQLEHARQKGLREQAVATDRDYEIAETALQTTRAKVREAQERLNLLRKGPRQEQLDQARARFKQARQALALAETRLGYATLLSPLAGVVLSHHAQPGEYVAPGTPVVTVGDLERPWLRAYINETDLGRVKLGQTVTLTTDTFPGRQYEGRLAFISSQAEFTPKNVQTKKERVKLVYRIKVEAPNPNLELKPGMPADAVIHLDGNRP